MIRFLCFRSAFLLLLLLFIPGATIYAQTDIVADEALAPVKINNKWGYIDKLGKLVIPARYDAAGVFTEGCAPVRVSIFWGYINKKGDWFLKPVFTAAANFNNRRANISLFDPTDSTTITGYISPEGEFIYKLEPFEVGYDYHDGYVRVRSADLTGMAFGYRDSTGQYVIQPRFDGAMDFSEGLAAMMLGTKWGFTSPKDDFAVFPNYDEAYSFTNGLAFVKQGNKKGFINHEGKMVINLSSYEEVSPFMYEEMISVRKKGKIGFVNNKGKLKIKAVYDNPLFGSFNEGLAAVAVKDADGNLKWGFIDKAGKMIIEPVFDEANNFFQDRARVKIDGKYNFIDKKGNRITETGYDEAFDFTPTYK